MVLTRLRLYFSQDWFNETHSLKKTVSETEEEKSRAKTEKHVAREKESLFGGTQKVG